MENKQTKYRADIAAVGESRWSNNGMEYDTPEEAKNWLDGLSLRWFGYDLARVVSTDVPTNQPIDFSKDEFYQKFRSGV